MKNEIFLENWEPTVKFRWYKSVLQQMYISNLGNKMWENIEIVNE